MGSKTASAKSILPNTPTGHAVNLHAMPCGGNKDPARRDCVETSVGAQ